MLFSTDAFQFTLQVIANFPKSRWLTIFLKVANVLGLKLTSYYNITINISVQDMTNHETNLRNHVLWHLKLFSGRLLVKIVERGKRKEETEKSSKCHKTWFRFLTTSVIQANSSIKNRTRTWFWKQNAVVWKSHRKRCTLEIVFALQAESNIRMRQRNVIIRVYVGKWLICHTILTSCGNKPFHKKRTTLK